MIRIAVANVKGGTGKSTVATHLAVHFAAQGFSTQILDLDRQRAASAWGVRRDASLPPVEVVEMDPDDLSARPNAAYVVYDVPPGLRGKPLRRIVSVSDIVVVPMLPSVFDEAGTDRLNDLIDEQEGVVSGRVPVALVGNRVRRGSVAERRLSGFAEELGRPLVTTISDAQLYGQLAAVGQTVFDMPAHKVRSALREWAGLTDFVRARISENAED